MVPVLSHSKTFQQQRYMSIDNFLGVFYHLSAYLPILVSVDSPHCFIGFRGYYCKPLRLVCGNNQNLVIFDPLLKRFET